MLPFFVYGTLRRTGSNAHMLQGKVARTATAQADRLTMLHMGTYPMCVEGQDVICGELVWVKPEDYSQILARLDALEGHPDYYHRVKRRVTVLPGGNLVQAWIYLGTHPQDHHDCPRIAHGDWLAMREASQPYIAPDSPDGTVPG